MEAEITINFRDIPSDIVQPVDSVNAIVRFNDLGEVDKVFIHNVSNPKQYSKNGMEAHIGNVVKEAKRRFIDPFGDF
jgi:hypothetical protein